MIDRDLAEDRGYQSYRCPRCKRRFATDSAVECPYCGEGERDEAEEADEPAVCAEEACPDGGAHVDVRGKFSGNCIDSLIETVGQIQKGGQS